MTVYRKQRDGRWLLFPRCPHFVRRGLTPRWSQRPTALEFMDGFSYKTIIELAEPLARRRGSALDR